LTGTRPRDEAWFKTLYTHHYGELWRMINVRIGDLSIAEDLTDETFLTAWSRPDKVPDDEEEALRWLRGTARNLVYHHWRSVSRHGLELTDIDSLLLPDLAMTDVGDAVADIVDRRRAIADLRRAFPRLGYKDRELLLSYHADGLPAEQLARELGIEIDALHQRLSRARDRLRRLMRKHTLPHPPRQPDVQVRRL